MISTRVQIEHAYYDGAPSPLGYSHTDVDELQGRVDLELMVCDNETGRAVPNALISLDAIGRTAKCDDQGRVVLLQVPTGEYTIDAIKSGYLASSTLFSLRLKTPCQLNIRMIHNG